MEFWFHRMRSEFLILPEKEWKQGNSKKCTFDNKLSCFSRILKDFFSCSFGRKRCLWWHNNLGEARKKKGKSISTFSKMQLTHETMEAGPSDWKNVRHREGLLCGPFVSPPKFTSAEIRNSSRFQNLSSLPFFSWNRLMKAINPRTAQ